MKKIIITSAIMLLMMPAFGQGRTGDRRDNQRQAQKSEVVRKARENRKNPAATRSTHTQNRSATHQVRPGGRQSETQVRIPSDVKKRSSTEAASRNREARTQAYRTEQNKASFRKGNYTGNRATQVRRPTRNTTVTSNNKRTSERRRQYVTPNRSHVRHGGTVHHKPVKYRRIHHYRAPKRINVIWTSHMYREYRVLYPEFRYWYYPVGYRIVTIPAYRAYFHIGEVRNVYGMIHEVWYDRASDQYLLYFGGSYPHQDFTVILPGRQARRLHRHPQVFFPGQYVWVTGLLSSFDGKPEIMVHRASQVHLY